LPQNTYFARLHTSTAGAPPTDLRSALTASLARSLEYAFSSVSVLGFWAWISIRAQGDFAGARPLHERALAIYEKALHDKALRRDHPRTKDSARVTADALDALGRTEEAKALRERYGVTEAREMQ
jgi:hypothetical protein